MSWAQRIDEAPTTRAKLRLLGEAMDAVLLTQRPVTPRPESKLQPIGERHLESVDVTRIFEHWCKVMGKRNTAKLTPERRSKIKARLKQGYKVPELLKAIDGCASSDFHMARGEYQGQTKYDDLTMLFNSGARVERFIEIADQHKPKDPGAFLGESA